MKLRFYKLLNLLLFTWAVSLLFINNLCACSCAAPEGTIEEQVSKQCDQSVAVFIGTVTSIKKLSPKEYSKEFKAQAAADGIDDLEIELTEFEVVEVFKGPEAQKIHTEIVTICCLCGYKFETGGKYIVYADHQLPGGAYDVSGCSRTRAIENTETETLETELLRKLKSAQ